MTLKQTLKQHSMKKYYITLCNQTVILNDYNKVIEQFGQHKVRVIHVVQDIAYIKVL